MIEPKTKQQAISERQQEGQDLSRILLSAMFGDLGRLPTYNSVGEVYREAMKDIGNRDYSCMEDYLDSLVKIADFYKEMAEHYFSCVDMEKYEIDNQGYLFKRPPAVD